MRDKGVTASEDQIQATAVSWLRLNGYSPVKIHNEGKRSPIAAAKLKRAGLHPGAADIVVPLDGGKVAWVEFKSASGRIRESQHHFRDLMIARGHRYIVARELEDVMTEFGGEA